MVSIWILTFLEDRLSCAKCDHFWACFSYSDPPLSDPLCSFTRFSCRESGVGGCGKSFSPSFSANPNPLRQIVRHVCTYVLYAERVVYTYTRTHSQSSLWSIQRPFLSFLSSMLETSSNTDRSQMPLELGEKCTQNVLWSWSSVLLRKVH